MKESNRVIQKQTQKLQQTIKISATKTNSYIAFQDVTPEASKVRIDAVHSLGRLATYSAEPRRVLPIVAADYPQTYLTENFKCLRSKVTAARVHRILFDLKPTNLTKKIDGSKLTNG